MDVERSRSAINIHFLWSGDEAENKIEFLFHVKKASSKFEEEKSINEGNFDVVVPLNV